jgi:hypothetical protein
VAHADQSIALVVSFKKALLCKHGTAEKAFKSLNRNGLVSKKEWKKALMRLMPELNVFEFKRLAKQMPKKAKKGGFVAFLGGGTEVAESVSASVEDRAHDGLAALPNEGK